MLALISNCFHTLMLLCAQAVAHFEPLEAQGLASSTDNSALDTSGSNQRVGVGHRGQSACLGSVRSTTEVVVSGNSIAVVGGVEGLAGSNESVGLDKDLGTVTSVDAVADVIEVAVVDVASSEAERWGAGVDVVPVVVVLGNVEVTGVLGTVVVGVADQRGLPVVVNIGVGHRDVVSCVGDLKICQYALLTLISIG